MYFAGYGITLTLTSTHSSSFHAATRFYDHASRVAEAMGFRYKLTPQFLLGCSFMAGTKSFRTAWAIQFIPCVFLLAGLPFLPRSPRWLAKVGRVDEAVEILARIQAGGDLNNPLVVAEWEEITTILAAERGKKPSDSLSTISTCRPLQQCPRGDLTP